MACEGLRTCVNPGSFCPDNKYDLGACQALPLDLRFNPGSFLAGVPNVPPVLEEIFDLECESPANEVFDVFISSQSGQSFFRTSDVIFNQRFRARLFLFQANEAKLYTIIISNNTFAPFITAHRAVGVEWQATGANLVINVAADQTGPITVEVTTQFPRTFGSFDIRLECEGGSSCMGAEGCPSLDISTLCSWDIFSGHVDLVGSGCNVVLGDTLPGNGMYLDLSGTLASTQGQIQTKESFMFAIGKTYKLSYKMAGSHRSPPGPNFDRVLLGIGPINVLNTVREIHNSTPFTIFEHPGLAGNGLGKIFFKSLNEDIILQAGAFLKEVTLENTTDDVIMFHSLF